MSNTSTGLGAWITSAAIVSVCALIFTVLSFWWLNARQGRLKSFEPHTFAAVVSKAMVRLRLPLVLYNTGAKPIIVQNLRLSFPAEPDSVLPLPWQASHSQIKPDSDDGHAFPSVFSVPGRSAQQVFLEFGAPWPGFMIEGRDYQGRLEVQLGHKPGWQHLLSFTLRAGHIIHPGNFITYSNVPDSVSQEDREKARAALEKLVRELSPESKSAEEGE